MKKLSEREFLEALNATTRVLDALRALIRLKGKYPDGIADRLTAAQRKRLAKVEDEIKGLVEL